MRLLVVLILYIFFSLGCEAHRSGTGCPFFKKCPICSDTYPLKVPSCRPTYLKPPIWQCVHHKLCMKLDVVRVSEMC